MLTLFRWLVRLTVGLLVGAVLAVTLAALAVQALLYGINTLGLALGLVPVLLLPQAHALLALFDVPAALAASANRSLLR